MGVSASASDDAITIEPLPANALQAHTLQTYHDHRMAMAFSLIGSRSGNLRVDDKAVVAKTYPHYWQGLRKAHSGGLTCYAVSAGLRRLAKTQPPIAPATHCDIKPVNVRVTASGCTPEPNATNASLTVKMATNPAKI